MNIEMKNAVIDEACNELRGMLNEHIDTIDQSMQSMLAEHDKDTEFTYNVSLGLKLTPRPTETKVAAKIGYSVRHSDESVCRIADPMQIKMDLD